MLPHRTGSTNTTRIHRGPSASSNRMPPSNSGRNSARSRPKFVANTLSNANGRPMTNNSSKKSKAKTRCNTCNKKINITNTFSCRCEKSFCPKHRHSELHNCTYDYKTEGKKQLELANPVITVPKLPKI